MKHIRLSTNAGGVENIVSISDDGELVTRDVQRGSVVQVILDDCAKRRQLVSNMPPGSRHNMEAQGYIAARIPITLWQTWRREWQEKYRNYFTWQTFEIMKLNSREYQGFKCVDWKIQVPDNVRLTGWCVTTRAELIQDLDAWLGRDDVSTDADAGTMLRMAEAELNRRLRTRAQEVVTTLTCTQRSTALPAEYLDFRFATLQSSLGREIEYLTPERIREAPIWNNQGGGLTDNTASAMTVEGDSSDDGSGGYVVTLAPEPTAGAPVTLDIGYFRTFPALTADDDTNWLLSNHYDIYMYACLMQVGVWDDDEVLQAKYERLLDRAIGQIASQENRARIPASKGLVATGSPRRIV